MNKKNIEKLKLFFMGITSRYEENKEFFLKASFQFKSGKKQFLGMIEEVDGNLNYSFNGQSKTIEFQDGLTYICEEATNYEELKFTYEERGSNVIIDANEKGVSVKYETPEKEKDLTNNQLASQLKRDYYIKVGAAKELLEEIGILTAEGKVKNDMIRKYNQIDHFIEVVEPMLKRFFEKNDSITILDCACGKSYLTFVLNYYIKEVMKKNCYFIGVDYMESVIESSKERAKRLKYKNMEFIAEDLRVYNPNRDIDMVISLHACDTATDLAISTGIRLESKSMVVVPCCHKELLEQISNTVMEPVFKHGIFKARFNDVMTDALRTLFIESYGYEVSALEYISPLDTPKNLMIRAFKTKESNEKAKQEYRELKKMFNLHPTMEMYVY